MMKWKMVVGLLILLVVMPVVAGQGKVITEQGKEMTFQEWISGKQAKVKKTKQQVAVLIGAGLSAVLTAYIQWKRKNRKDGRPFDLAYGYNAVLNAIGAGFTIIYTVSGLANPVMTGILAFWLVGTGKISGDKLIDRVKKQ